MNMPRGQSLWNTILTIGLSTIMYPFMLWGPLVGIIYAVSFFFGYFSITKSLENRLYRVCMKLSFLVASCYPMKGKKEDLIFAFSKKGPIDVGTIGTDEPLWFDKLFENIRNKMKVKPEQIAEENKRAKEITEDLKQKYPDLDLPNTLHATLINLYDGVSFADSNKHTFRQNIILTRRDYEKEIEFTDLGIIYKGHPISAQAAEVKMINVDWIAHDFPIWLVVFTDVDAFDHFDAIHIHDTIHKLKFEIFRRMIYHYRRYFQRFDLEIDELTDDLEEEQERASKFRQMIEDERERNQDIIADGDNGIRLKGWHVFLLLLGWVLAGIFGGLKFL